MPDVRLGAGFRGAGEQRVAQFGVIIGQVESAEYSLGAQARQHRAHGPRQLERDFVEHRA